MYKFDFPAIGRMFIRFFVRNRDVLEKGAVYGVGAMATGFISKKLDIPMNVDFGANVAKLDDIDDWRHADSPQYAAIKALTDSAENTWSANEKLSAVKSIRSIALSNSVEWVNSYAIKSLQRIANSTGYSSVKTEIAKVIGDLGRRVQTNG